ncbi:MAG: hypothetical protein ACLT8E_01100 [Akkermansia sp.]
MKKYRRRLADHQLTEGYKTLWPDHLIPQRPVRMSLELKPNGGYTRYSTTSRTRVPGLPGRR